MRRGRQDKQEHFLVAAIRFGVMRRQVDQYSGRQWLASVGRNASPYTVRTSRQAASSYGTTYCPVEAQPCKRQMCFDQHLVGMYYTNFARFSSAGAYSTGEAVAGQVVRLFVLTSVTK